jgi:hypothetical protein
MLPVVMNPPKPVSLLTAITALALAARIHGTDKAVLFTAYRMLPRMNLDYMPVVLAVMNAPSPLKHIDEYVATLPSRVLEMKVKAPALPLLSAVESRHGDRAPAVDIRNRLAGAAFDQGQSQLADLTTTACYWPTRGTVRDTSNGAIVASTVA